MPEAADAATELRREHDAGHLGRQLRGDPKDADGMPGVRR